MAKAKAKAKGKAKAKARPAGAVGKGAKIKVTHPGSWAEGKSGIVDRIEDGIAHVMIEGKGALKQFALDHIKAL